MCSFTLCSSVNCINKDLYTILMLMHVFPLLLICYFSLYENVFASGSLYKINEIMKYLYSLWSHIESDTVGVTFLQEII